MNAKDIASLFMERVQHMLTERLKNFSNEARIAIEKKAGIKLNERDRLGIILKSLKNTPREIAVELIRNSSLNNDDRAFLNILCGDPEVNVLLQTKTTTVEEVFGDELPTGSKILAIPNELKEWPRKDVAVTDED